MSSRVSRASSHPGVHGRAGLRALQSASRLVLLLGETPPPALPPSPCGERPPASSCSPCAGNGPGCRLPLGLPIFVQTPRFHPLEQADWCLQHPLWGLPSALSFRPPSSVDRCPPTRTLLHLPHPSGRPPGCRSSSDPSSVPTVPGPCRVPRVTAGPHCLPVPSPSPVGKAHLSPLLQLFGPPPSPG